MEAPSRFARLLQAGEFIVTAELSAVDSADPHYVYRKADLLAPYVDAINCTDNTGAHVHISSMAAARLLIERGIEPIMQMTTRDRNRLALQADLLGAAALGVRNFVLMSGDDVSAGDHPEARALYDIDSLQLISVARTLRDRGEYMSGRRLTSPPSFFIGAVENPFAPPLEYRPIRLLKKVEAGADFIQTQLVYDLDLFKSFMGRLEEIGVLDRVFIIPSIGIPRSAKGMRFMKEKVPGVHVPDELVRRMEQAQVARQAETGIEIGVEIVHALQGIRGVAGVHLIAIKWEEGLVRVLEQASLRKRPAPVVA
jgi:methylenetetrahydrofolate reductase (NADPH)